jgi:hypothetical protein
MTATTSTGTPPATPDLNKLTLPTIDELEKLEAEQVANSGQSLEPEAELEVSVIENGYGSIGAWVVAIASIIGIYALSYWMMDLYGISSVTKVVSSGGIVAICAVFLYGYFGCGADAQQALVFVNEFTGAITAYKWGYYLIFPWQTPDSSNPIIDFRKDEERLCATHDKDASKSTAITAVTANGFPFILEWELIERPLEQHVSRFIRFKKDVRDARIRAVMNSRLCQAVGTNNWQTVLKNQSELMTWVNKIFRGDKVTSEFEKYIGTGIFFPVLKGIRPGSPEAEALVAKEFNVDQVNRVIADLIKLGIKPEEAHQRALLSLGIMNQQIFDVRGIPAGATTVVVGDHTGLALKQGGK